MHIVLVGTKAQLVKMAPVLQELEKQYVPHLFVLTGQHSETMEDLISAFKIKTPDDVLVNHGEADTKIRLFEWLKAAWKSPKTRDYFRSATSILVHGDTMSTLLGAHIGRRFKIPVAHIEAGLRSFNYFHPFPEEITRVLVSRKSSIHFCPGEWATNNLAKYKLKSNHQVIDTKLNTIVDSLRYALQNQTDQSSGDPYAVVSLHRYENLSNEKRFKQLMDEIIKASKTIPLKFILHPVTRLKLVETGMDKQLLEENISLQERMDYVSFMQLLSRSKFLITDGGSNQEEAAYMGLPCLIMRKATERQEGIGENAILSMYDLDITEKFIEMHYQSDWNLNKLPGIFPSRQIVSHLKTIQN